MSRDTKRYLILLVVLLIAAGALLGMTYREEILGRAWKESGYQFVTDIDNWRKTDRERLLRSPYDFRLGSLHTVPLNVGTWKGHDVPQTNREVFILLEPDEYVFRRYCNGSDCVWLSLIGSHQAKSFHPPDICYEADGWGVSVGSEPVKLKSGEIRAMKVVAKRGGNIHVILYFYIWPDPSRDPQKGTVLFKVTASGGKDVGHALEVDKEFIREFFTAARKP